MGEFFGGIILVLSIIGFVVGIVVFCAWNFPNDTTNLFHNNSIICITHKGWKTFGDTSNCYHLIPEHEY